MAGHRLIGDGAFQPDCARNGFQMIPLLLPVGHRLRSNNHGYTIEVEIHDGPYNNVKNWIMPVSRSVGRFQCAGRQCRVSFARTMAASRRSYQSSRWICQLRRKVDIDSNASSIADDRTVRPDLLGSPGCEGERPPAEAAITPPRSHEDAEAVQAASAIRSTRDPGESGYGYPQRRTSISIIATVPNQPAPVRDLKPLFFLAWLLCAIFYFFQYAVRSAPGVMQEELTAAWGGNNIVAMISAYYVAYAIMALVAGVLLDRYGARRSIPLGIVVVAIGCLIFAQGGEAAGMIGFVLQAIGAIFAFIGSSYVAARYLPARMLAAFIGFTQCLGMAGAAFGSKPVHMAIDPAGHFQIGWQYIWMAFACAGFALAAATWIIMPRENGDSESHHGPLSISALLLPFRIVFGNVQSWLAGIVGGSLFLPTRSAR